MMNPGNSALDILGGAAEVVGNDGLLLEAIVAACGDTIRLTVAEGLARQALRAGMVANDVIGARAEVLAAKGSALMSAIGTLAVGIDFEIVGPSASPAVASPALGYDK